MPALLQFEMETGLICAAWIEIAIGKHELHVQMRRVC
jgi:hypothetical protein